MSESVYKRVASTDDKTRLGTYGFNVDMRVGTLPGEAETLNGNVIDIDAGQTRTVGSGLILSEQIEFDTTRTGVSLSVASSSADDDIVGTTGTGAHVITFGLIDSNGDVAEPTASLDGTNPVVIDSPNTFIACNNLAAIILGTTGSNQGIVYVGPTSATWMDGKPDEIWGVMDTNNNTSRYSFFYVPNSISMVPCHIFVSTTASTTQDVEVDINISLVVAGSNVKFHGLKLYFGNGSHNLSLDCRNPFAAGTALELLCLPHNGNNIDVSVTAGFLLVPV